MVHLTSNRMFVQSSEIIEEAIVQVIDKIGRELFRTEIAKTNFFSVDIEFPNGTYQLIVKEKGKQWKRNIYI